MTQKNIDIMAIIVDEMGSGKTFANALKTVYTKRSMEIPFSKELLGIRIMDLGMSNRTTNALLRGRLHTVNDIVNFTKRDHLMNLKNFGKGGGIELLETLANWCWDHLTNDERTVFLIDTVKRNENNIRKELK